MQNDQGLHIFVTGKRSCFGSKLLIFSNVDQTKTLGSATLRRATGHNAPYALCGIGHKAPYALPRYITQGVHLGGGI